MTPFQHQDGDEVEVAVRALRDSGVRPDDPVTVLAYPMLESQGFIQQFSTLPYTLAGCMHSRSFVDGLQQACDLLSSARSTLVLVLGRDDMGIGALVIATENVLVNGDPYAVIEAIGSQSSDEVETLCQQAMTRAHITPAEIGYLEVNRPDLGDWVLDSYRQAGFDLTCALSSISAQTTISQSGEHQVNTGICGFIKAVCALHSRTLPTYPGWAVPGERKRWEHTPFYTLQEARSWFIEPDKERRYAAWLHVEPAAVGHIILSEPAFERLAPPVKSILGDKTVWLLPIAGANREQLREKLNDLSRRIDEVESLEVLANHMITTYQKQQDLPFALALVGRHRDELKREIELAHSGVDKAFLTGTNYRTPRGSVFTSQPQGDGDIVFVYPGAFNSYVGFGRELLLHFPVLYERLSVLISNVGRSLAERRLYPRSLEPFTDDEMTAWALRLSQNPIAMIESGTTFSIAYSMIMREIFEIQPHAAMGYSLGEISMLWAAGVWNAGDAGSDAWHASPLFKTRLFGPKLAVCEAWDIQPDNEKFWSTYLLKASESEVRPFVEAESRVYLTIINLPSEVVIAGDGEGCQRIIQALGCHAIKVPYDSVIHNEVVRSEYDTFVKLYTHPIHHIPDTTFYSAAEYAPLELDSESLAHAIADMTCKPVDLPRLVNTVYEDGGRVFIELGPQATCSRWIERILKGKPHIAVPINRTGLDDFHGIITVLAQLITHGIRVNLNPLLTVNQQPRNRRVIAPRNPVTGTSQTEPEFIQDSRISQKQSSPVSQPTRSADVQPVLDQGYNVYMAPFQTQMVKTHLTFLQSRHHALLETSTLIQMQLAAADKMLSGAHGIKVDRALDGPRFMPITPSIRPEPPPVYFGRRQLEAFASGNVEMCFGSDYAVYRGRRLPRIPNGDLLLMDRIIELDATRGEFGNEPSLMSAYDVPFAAWYFQQDVDMVMPPYAVLMETALQPCGFLAAYLGSTLSSPDVDYYFRNLDGTGLLLRNCDLRGKTINNRVQLKSSIKLSDIIMQRYTYTLSCDGQPFFSGEASFGYFTARSLSEQAGLDIGQLVSPYLTNSSPSVEAIDVPPLAQVNGLDLCAYSATGGRYGKGYIYGEAQVVPDAWFYDCHFYQDPVMPGSLGVDLVIQAMELSMRRLWQGQAVQNLVRSEVSGNTTMWRYRGQVTPNNQRLMIECHVKDKDEDDHHLTLRGQASVWVDNLRIYEVDNLALTLYSHRQNVQLKN
ncbi:MAG: PfaB family protein [Anaerolineae bacterium]|nr:PfaB family protein [Anaerolineae bacterium]